MTNGVVPTGPGPWPNIQTSVTELLEKIAKCRPRGRQLAAIDWVVGQMFLARSSIEYGRLKVARRPPSQR